MLSLAVNGYTVASVQKALHVRQGARKIAFRYDLLNAQNVRKFGLTVEGGSISFDGGAEIKRTGRFTLRDDARIDWQNDRIRPWFRLEMPDGKWAEWPLGIFYMPTAPITTQGGTKWRDVEAYDQSMILQDDQTDARHFIAAGTNYVAAISSLLLSAGVAHGIIEDTALTINADREWDIGVPKGTIIAELLREINYTDLYVDASGYFRAKRYLSPANRPIDYAYRADDMSVVIPGGISEIDLFRVPNVFVGIVSSPDVGELYYKYINDNAADPLSVQQRNGRKVVKIMQYDDIASLDVLQSEVRKEVELTSQAYEQCEFETLLMPHHEYNDLLYLDHSSAHGRYVETGWSMDLAAGSTMRHTAQRQVIL